MRWQICIEGDKFALEYLSASFTGETLAIEKYEGEYFLSAAGWDSLANVFDVYVAAADVVVRLNGAARVGIGLLSPIVTTVVYETEADGKKHMWDYAGRVPIRLPIDADATKAAAAAARNPTKLLYEASLSNSALASALRVLAIGFVDWVMLYRLYEIIERDMGGQSSVIDQGWITRADLRRFKHTANTPSVAGPLARHGVDRAVPPRAPMSLGDAQALVGHIFQLWAAMKVPALGGA